MKKSTEGNFSSGVNAGSQEIRWRFDIYRAPKGTYVSKKRKLVSGAHEKLSDVHKVSGVHEYLMHMSSVS